MAGRRRGVILAIKYLPAPSFVLKLGRGFIGKLNQEDDQVGSAAVQKKKTHIYIYIYMYTYILIPLYTYMRAYMHHILWE